SAKLLVARIGRKELEIVPVHGLLEAAEPTLLELPEIALVEAVPEHRRPHDLRRAVDLLEHRPKVRKLGGPALCRRHGGLWRFSGWVWSRFGHHPNRSRRR